jgi:hypothetical protein
MGDEFYAIIKLTSGEELLSLVCIDEDQEEPTLILQNPVIVKIIHNSAGIQVKIKPWMEMSDDDFFIIKPDKIITMTETKDERLISIFNSYLEEDYEPFREFNSGKVKPSEKMGYVSTVEDARQMLENLYNIKDIKES